MSTDRPQNDDDLPSLSTVAARLFAISEAMEDAGDKHQLAIYAEQRKTLVAAVQVLSKVYDETEHEELIAHVHQIEKLLADQRGNAHRFETKDAPFGGGDPQ